MKYNRNLEIQQRKRKLNVMKYIEDDDENIDVLNTMDVLKIFGEKLGILNLKIEEGREMKST